MDFAPSLAQNDNAVVNHIPEELLSDIFDRFIHHDPSNYHSHLSIVTSVCHLWRQVALDCGVLWTNIDYKPPAPFRIISDVLLQRAASYLMRSKASPVAVEIWLDYVDPTFLPQINEIIYPHLHHCRYFSIRISSVDVHHFFPLPSQLSTLRELNIAFIGLARSESTITLLPSGTDCRLNRLCIETDAWHSSDDWKLDVSNIDTQDMRFIEFGGHSSTGPAAVDLARRSPRLEVLRVNMLTVASKDLFLDGRINFPTLISLDLRTFTSAFQRLKSSSLRHLIMSLHIDSLEDIGATGLPSVFPNIRSLQILFLETYSESIVRSILSAHPRLLALGISIVAFPIFVQYFSRALSASLGPEGGGQIQFVRVECFSPRGVRIVEAMGAFVEMVQDLPHLTFQFITPEPSHFSELVRQFPGRVEVAKTFSQSIADVADTMEGRL